MAFGTIFAEKKNSTSISDKDIKFSDTIWIDRHLKEYGNWRVTYITNEDIDYAEDIFYYNHNLKEICELVERIIKDKWFLDKAKIER